MGSIKHPSGDDAVSSQTGPGAHPRGTGGRNPDNAGAGMQQGGARRPDLDDIPHGPDNLERDPGIGRSAGTSTSGEDPLDEKGD
ncbi:MAG TPA: hypothetical protein VEH84_10535 [Alphaproteobacteria bacterium]|nr:hypothetical protein [Alphaproteobacteria bacterium]